MEECYFTISYANGDVIYQGANISNAFSVEYDVDCVETPMATNFNITAIANPTEGGVVSGSGMYNNGDTCTVVATANEGYSFMYWTEKGQQVSADAAYSFTVLWERDLVAQFTLPLTVTASVNLPESGLVSGSGNYDYGSECTLTAEASEGYTFVGWTENGDYVSVEESYSFIVTEDRALVANFVEGYSECAIVFDLYDGYGDGWSGNTLVVDYGNGNQEYLTIPDGNYYGYTRLIEHGSHISLSWIQGAYMEECYFTISYANGDVIYQGANMSSAFSMEYDVDCVETPLATFGITVVASPTEGGFISGSGEYDFGTECTLTATANGGFAFMYWMENGVPISTDSIFSFIVNSNRDLLAYFEELPPHWTASEYYPNSMFMVGVVLIDGVEQASPALELGAFCNGECRGTEFPEFVEGRWVYYMNIGGNNGDEITFRLYDHSQQQEMNLYCFNVLPFETYGLIGMDVPYEVLFTSTVAVSSSVSPEDAGTVTGTGEYELGAEATVTATANAGYQFNSWAIDGEIVSTEASYTFTVTAPVSLTANFDVLYSVSADVNLEGAGTVTGEGEYLYGTDVTLTATANAGYAFNNWTLEGEVVSTEPNYSFTVTGSVVVTANFNVVHTQQLVQGYNWFSTFVEITLDDLKAALVAALPGTTISIISQSDGSTTYNGSRWRGSLNSLDLSQMYMINVTADCEMTLEGMPIDPSEHVATIHPNFNWMAFPLRQGMTLTNAFAGFVVNGDMVTSQSDGFSTYYKQWRGSLNGLEPGKGYMYKSVVTTGDRTFTFPVNAK